MPARRARARARAGPTRRCRGPTFDGVSRMCSPYWRRRTRRGSRRRTGRPRCGRGCRRGSRATRASCCRRPTRRCTPGTRARARAATARAAGDASGVDRDDEHDDAPRRRSRAARATALPRRVAGIVRMLAARRARPGASVSRSACGRPGRACRTTATPSGEITYVSGWPVVPNVNAVSAPGSSAATDSSWFALDVRSGAAAGSSSRTMPTIAKSGSSLVRGVERLERRAPPAGTGCTTCSRSSRRTVLPARSAAADRLRRRASCSCEGRPRAVLRHEPGRRRLACGALHREHHAERDEHDADRRRDPADGLADARLPSGRRPRPASGSIVARSSDDAGTVTTRRAGASGTSATRVPSAMITPPIHSHITIVPTCTPIVDPPRRGRRDEREVHVVPRVAVDRRRADALGGVRERRDRGRERAESPLDASIAAP